MPESLRPLLVLVLAMTGASELPAAEVYAPWTLSAARDATLAWAQSRPGFSPEVEATLRKVWQTAGTTPADRLDAAIESFAIVEPDVRQLLNACAAQGGTVGLLDSPALQTSADNPFYAHNLRAWYARFLATRRAYDEALELYDEIELASLIDPATSLFYRAVCEHSLLMREEGLTTLKKLTEQTEEVPRRYATVAALMQRELEGLREKSLGEVALQMADVERRLELGHAGQRVQRQEERIITTLDEIIKKLEEQQGGGGGGGGGGQSQGGAPSNPAEESYLGGIKGPGEVEPKAVGHESGWGNLPEKEQARVKNLLDKQFPSHYRQAVTEYLRKLGQRPAPTSK